MRASACDVMSAARAKADGDDHFYADAALFIGELRQLLPELIAALGGEPPPKG